MDSGEHAWGYSFVVVPSDQPDLTVQLLSVGLGIFCRKTEVPEMEDAILRPNNTVPVLDQLCVHLVYGCERSVAELSDVVVSEVLIRRKEYHLYPSQIMHSFFLAGLNFLILRSSRAAAVLLGKTLAQCSLTGPLVLVYLAPFPQLCASIRFRRSTVIPV